MRITPILFKSLPANDPQKDYALLTTFPETDVMASLQSSFPNTAFTQGSSGSTGTGATSSALTNSVTQQVADAYPPAPPAPQAAPGMMFTVWGTQVSTSTHNLLGYNSKGQPEYSDAAYNDGEILFPTPS